MAKHPRTRTVAGVGIGVLAAGILSVGLMAPAKAVTGNVMPGDTYTCPDGTVLGASPSLAVAPSSVTQGAPVTIYGTGLYPGPVSLSVNGHAIGTGTASCANGGSISVSYTTTATDPTTDTASAIGDNAVTASAPFWVTAPSKTTVVGGGTSSGGSGTLKPIPPAPTPVATPAPKPTPAPVAAPAPKRQPKPVPVFAPAPKPAPVVKLVEPMAAVVIR
ncbi:hypothetical protein [Sinomonas sp. RB5]